MSKYEVREVTNKKEWEGFLLSRKPGTFLQSWNWGEVNISQGFKVIRLAVYEGLKIIACAQMIFQPAKRGRHYLIPGGPVADYSKTDALKILLDDIKTKAKEDGAWFVRVRPDEKSTDILLKEFKDFGFVRSPMHVHGENTIVLDITNDLDDILKNMRKTTRYLIRKSENSGLSLEIFKDSKQIDILTSLQEDTVKRHKFIGFSEKLFKLQMDIFGNEGQALFFVCKMKNIPLAAAIIMLYGEKAFYHHSGSSNEGQKTNSSYFMQWEIIKEVKRLGYKYYDFWGIAPTDNPNHRFAGVTTFKKGFGGERLDWLHAQDLIISPMYWLTYVFETFRRKFRRL